MTAIIRPSQENGLTEDKDACWRINDDNDSTWDRQPSICICARAFGFLWKKTTRS